MMHIIQTRRERTYVKDTQIIVNNHGIIIHKIGLKKGRRGMTMTYIKRIIL
jgi:hypothetical protein